MAVEAGAGLLALSHALGGELIGQHVGMALALVEIDGKGIAIEDGHQPGILLDAAFGQALAAGAAVLGAVLLGGAQVGVVLPGKVLPPLGGIDGLLIELHQLEAGLPGLGLAAGDARIQAHHQHRGEGSASGQEPHPDQGTGKQRSGLVGHRRDPPAWVARIVRWGFRECRKVIGWGRGPRPGGSAHSRRGRPSGSDRWARRGCHAR